MDLALSSRNNYLTLEEKETAAHLYKLLQEVANEIIEGRKDYEILEQYGLECMHALGFIPDYFSIVSQKNLKEPQHAERSLVILAACTLHQVRLIDNIKIQL